MMKPIGLRFKNQKLNPYTGRTSGELMIIHQCIGCGRISSNRIAGDDNTRQILNLLERSRRISRNVTDKLRYVGIKPLSQRDKKQVLITLFGYGYEKSIK